MENANMKLVSHYKNASISWFEINDSNDDTFIQLVFTARTGGYSSSPYESLNMATHVGDDYEVVMSNREKVLSLLDLSNNNSVSAEQVHRDEIFFVTRKDMGKGCGIKEPIPKTDGLITKEHEIALLSFYADCVPIYIWDLTSNIIGIAHAGWKGTVLNIAGKMVENFCLKHRAKIENVKVAIGPSICKKCYEVDDNVFHAFQSVFTKNELGLICEEKENGKYSIDLWKANELLLLKRKILPKNIIFMNQCTSCNPDLFFSYRYENGETGRMAAIIVQKKLRGLI